MIIYELTSGTRAGKVTQVSRSGTTLTASGTINDWSTSTGANIPHGLTRLSDTIAIIVYNASTGVNEEQAKETQVVGTSANPGTALTLDSPNDNLNIGCAVVNTTTAIAIYQTNQVAVMTTSLITVSSVTHLWLSTDGAATFTNIGDATWAANVVGAVVVKPGTAYQTIWAAVGTSIFKTTNGGSGWTSLATVGYECDFMDLLDGDVLFVANRAAAGNRASLISSAGVVSHINTGKSTSGGATSGQGVA